MPLNSTAEPPPVSEPFWGANRPARLPRQPNAGSTLIVLAIFALSMAVVGFTGVYFFRRLHHLSSAALGAYTHPILSILIEFFAYGFTAAAAYPLLRTLWQRPVSTVLEMNWQRARPVSPILIASGLCLAVLAQLAAARMSMPKNMPIDNFFHSARDIWFMAVFGTFIAPLAEEVFFRGFLLKTFAIAFDWTRHFFGTAEREFWDTTDATSRPAWIFGAILSSALFAGMHAAQLGKAWNAVAVLSVVGLILAAVRIRMRSVWASSLLHMGYNGLLFVMLFFATDGFRHLDRMTR